MKREPFKLIRESCISAETIITTFKCLDCGCDKCYRPKRDYKLSHLEGHYYCLNCKKKVSYATFDFINKYIKNPKQLKLSLF